MKTIASRVVCAGFVALLLFGPVAHAQQRFGAGPVTLRIEGFVGPKPAALIPQASWVVLANEKKYTLHVARLEVLRGNTSYFDIIAALVPFSYAFTVYGDAATLRTFTDAPPNQKISIIANAQMAQLPGVLFLSSVEVVAAPTPAGSATPGS